MKVEGGCHCALVRFEAEIGDAPVEVRTCDCSICAMSGHVHLILSDTRFRLTDGQRETTTYRFGSGKARHIFCTQCGIKSFLRPRSHPDGVSINLHCIDDWQDIEVVTTAL